MGRILLVMAAGAALFFGAAWQLGLFEESSVPRSTGSTQVEKIVASWETLGVNLYEPKKFPEINLPKGATEPITMSFDSSYG